MSPLGFRKGIRYQPLVSLVGTTKQLGERIPLRVAPCLQKLQGRLDGKVPRNLVQKLCLIVWIRDLAVCHELLAASTAPNKSSSGPSGSSIRAPYHMQWPGKGVFLEVVAAIP